MNSVFFKISAKAGLLTHKNSFLSKLTVALAVTIFSVAIPVGYAEYTNTESAKDNFNNFMKGAQLNVVEKMAEAFSSFKDLYKPAGVVTFPAGIWGAIGLIAGSMVIIYFGINVVKEAQNNPDMTIDYWQKTILKLVISLIVTLMSTSIMGALYNLGDDLIGIFIGQISQQADGIDSNSIAQMLSTLHGMEKLSDLIGGKQVLYAPMTKMNQMLVGMEFVVWMPMVISVFLMYSAIFEIKIRELFAPIAVASIQTEGGRSGGARYLKKYAACFLKIAIYFALAYMGMFMTNYFYKEAVNIGGGELNMKFIFMMMSNVVAAMAMMQTGGIADEIVGA